MNGNYDYGSKCKAIICTMLMGIKIMLIEKNYCRVESEFKRIFGPGWTVISRIPTLKKRTCNSHPNPIGNMVRIHSQGSGDYHQLLIMVNIWINFNIFI